VPFPGAPTALRARDPDAWPLDHRAARRSDEVELFIFARFHARPGHERAVAEALVDVLAPSREEPGCLGIHAFRSIRDPRLFYIHSRWSDEAAFESHGGLPHTVRFLERVEPLIDHPLDVTRAERMG
jgi:quinol monooxygenase YgiN